MITNQDNVTATIGSSTGTPIATLTGSFVVAPVVTPTMAPVTVPVNHGEKLEKFNGLNFKRWQQKMLFYLTTLGLARFLTEDPPTKKDGE